MAAYADAAVIFWDGKSRGTKHMIDLMEKAGKLTLVCMFNEVNENNPVFPIDNATLPDRIGG